MFRIGLIGSGRMGLTHLRALASSRDVRPVAVAEPRQAAADHLRASGLSVYPTAASMLEAGGIDGVIVSVPTDQHAAVVELAASEGVSILCEKPCGVEPADVRAAAQSAQRHSVPLQIGYWRRFVPELQDLRSRIASGEVGELYSAFCVQWDEEPPPAEFRRQSGGLFVDMGVHEIDQLRWLTGQEVQDVAVSVFPKVGDESVVGDADSAQALLTLSGGCVGVISLGRFHAAGDLVEAEVFGSREHSRIPVLNASSGESPQLCALRAQAEAFARYAGGGSNEGATIGDAEAALEVADLLSTAANLRRNT